MKSRVMFVVAAAMCLFLNACNGYEKLLKSTDYEAKYAAAMRYYENNAYSRAIQLFENLTLYYRGREHAEEIAWYYAQSLFQSKDYYTAGYQFKRFVQQFPYSDNAEQGAFLSAYCKYMESPSHTLDQTLTHEAIEEFESFSDRWPRSVYMPQVIAYLDDMRMKLLMKEYEIAYGYYFIEEYHAAYESFKNFINLYPEAPMKEDAMYYLLRSGYEYAANSREDKQEERFRQVVNDYERFVSTYGESKYMPEAEKIIRQTRKQLGTEGQ